MTYSCRLLIVFGIGGALLSLLLPGCTRLVGQEEAPPPPVVTPQAKEEAPKPEEPKRWNRSETPLGTEPPTTEKRLLVEKPLIRIS